MEFTRIVVRCWRDLGFWKDFEGFWEGAFGRNSDLWYWTVSGRILKGF